MANEAKTSGIFRDFLREKQYYSDESLAVEEQKSENSKIDKLLKNASKKGNQQGYPDFIISSGKHSDFVLVVEAKADTSRHISDSLDNYASYAVDGALLYASFLAKEYDVLAIAVSGEEKSGIRISHYLHLKGEKKAYPIFGDQILSYEDYYQGVIQSDYKFNQDYAALLAYAKDLNEDLHARKITESQRALLISGIMIALKNRAFRESYNKHTKNKELINALYTTIEGQLSDKDIPEQKIDALMGAFSFVRTNKTLTDEEKGKEFLETLIQEIDEKINGFMVTHKYVDTMSQFYIEFLRYANNDKGLGIVLTPPHITELFVELADVDENSVVLDNCCGTGGFLISAMKKMILAAKGNRQKELEIKKNQLIGIEYQDNIYALLISNMIIHRDGRTNIFWGDCFQLIDEVKGKFRPTVGLLNPPYKTKASDVEELEFILNNLEALQPGGTCIAIVPLSCAIEKSQIARTLRKRLLEKHTLEAVLSMPEELFHNSKVNTVTCAMILTAHKPHPKGKKTWFAYCREDGFVKAKNKGRIDANHTWEKTREEWVTSYRNREVIQGFSVMREVNERDEWCVEAYLETDYSVVLPESYEETLMKYIMFHLIDLSDVDSEEEANEDV